MSAEVEPKERTYAPERKAYPAGPAAIGCITDDPTSDPEADASLISVMKGILSEMKAQTALLTQISQVVYVRPAPSEPPAEPEANTDDAE